MTFDEIINKKKKDWNCGDLMDVSATRTEKIPFSSPLMNWCTYGGIPRNKISEFFGENGSGKSTTAMDIAKNAIDLFRKEYEDKIAELQEKADKGEKSAKIELADMQELGPKKVLYVDLEHTFDTYWANILGVDCEEDISIMQPPNISAEDILQTIEDLISTNELGLVILDSIPSLVTQKELDKKYGEVTVAPLSGLLTAFTRKIIPILTRYNCTFLIINQIRDNLSNPYVVNTPGGKAVKFYASLRMQFRIGAPVDFLGNELPQKAENPSGYIVTAKLVKQKSAPFDRKQGTYYLMCQSGIAPMYDYANLAITKYNLIIKGGAWFTMVDPTTGEVMEENDKPVKVNGLANVYKYLRDNAEYFNKLKTYIINDINGIESSDDDNAEQISLTQVEQK